MSQFFLFRAKFSFYDQKGENLCIFFKFNFLDYIKFDLGPKIKNLRHGPLYYTVENNHRKSENIL